MLTHPSPEDIKDNLVLELLNILVKRGHELNLTDAIFHHNFLISLGHAFQQEEVFAIPALILSPSHGIVIVGTQNATPEQIEKFGSSEGLLQNAVFKLITHVVQDRFLRTKGGPLIPFNVVLFGKHFLGQNLSDYRTTKICATEAGVVKFFKNAERQPFAAFVFRELVKTIDRANATSEAHTHTSISLEESIASFDSSQVKTYESMTEGSHQTEKQSSVYSRRSNFCELLTGLLKRSYTGPGGTKLVSELSDAELASLKQHLPLTPAERLLMISSAQDLDWHSWCLISDQNVYWKCENESGKLSWDLIESAEVNDNLRQYDPFIDIQDKFGNTFVIKTEKFEGRELFRRVLNEIIYQRNRIAEEF